MPLGVLRMGPLTQPGWAKDRKVASGQSLEESLEDLQEEQQDGRKTPTEKPRIPAEGRPGSC